jgi:CheY-like chemotaxis protein
VKLLMCELHTTGREPPRLAGMDGIGASVATAQFGVVRGERQRRSGSSVRRETGDAAAQTTPAARPISVSPSLSSVRAAAVMLAPRATPTVRFSTGAPPDVLVIDDHAVNQELMTQMLLHLGCRARGVGSAEQGLADLCAASVDLVLMDIRMPGMDGLQALAWIRQGSSLRFALRTPASLPVVAVTAHAVAGDAERCLAHGFDAYLAKPCRLEDLCLVLEGLLAWCPAEPTASPSEATTQMGEGIPVFDHQALLRLQALDPSGQNQLLVRVMKAFELSLQRLSSQLRSARQQRDVSAVRQAAHTLKSSSASVGALRLSGLCLDVESALRRDGATFDVTPDAANEALGEPVGRLIDEIERVQAAVPQWLNAETGVSSEAPGNDPSRAASAPGS